MDPTIQPPSDQYPNYPMQEEFIQKPMQDAYPQPQGFDPQPQGFAPQPQGFAPQPQEVMPAQPVYVNQPQVQPITPILPPSPGVTYVQSPVYVVSPVANQVSPNQPSFNPAILASTLKSEAKIATCPYCKTVNTTRVEQTCNCGNVCCCLCTSLLCWVIFQAARGKDINCCDANHYCPKCNQLIFSYSAC